MNSKNAKKARTNPLLVLNREPHHQLNLSKRLGFLNSEALSVIEPKVTETEKVLNGLIISLKKNKFKPGLQASG